MSDKLRAAAKAVLESTKSLSVCCEDFSHRPQDLHRDGECPSWRRYNDALAALDVALAEPAIKESLTVRPWVGLTDREFQPMIQKAMAYYGYDQSEPSHLTAGAGFRVFAYAIEAKLREKNGG